jgi:3-hydroxyisobutyrate dehydrogenase
MQSGEPDSQGGLARGETVAVLGAGGMMGSVGSAMARKLLRAGLRTRAWDRTREKAAGLVEEGAVVVDTPADAAETASVILTMLSDAEAVLSAMTGEHGAVGAISGPVLWVQMSTIGEAGRGWRR